MFYLRTKEAILKQFIRALRLPFITACVLPFLFAFVRSSKSIDYVLLILGTVTVAAAHLSANLINDAADAKTGVDDFDHTYYGFFGGSKLIQEGKLSISWYYRAAVLAAICSAGCVLAIALKTGSYEIPLFYIAVMLLAWQYSCRPLAFAYRGLGEFIVFLLFGPVCIAGGSFFAGAGYPGPELLVISLVFGCLTSGILVANEVPDAEADLKGGKRTLVVRIGAHRGWLLFLLFEMSAWLLILFCWYVSYISALAAIPCFIGLPLAFYAAFILKKHPGCREKLTLSSRLTITGQIIAGLSLLLQEIF